MPLPPVGPSSNSPIQPMSSSHPIATSDAEEAKYAYLLTSPFAKMFSRTGAAPTGKEMNAIMQGILKQALDEMKKQDARFKESMRKLKDVIQGND